MKRTTITVPLKFTGPSLFSPRKNVRVYLNPKSSSGVSFQRRESFIEYNLFNVRGNSAFSGARYLKISTQDSIRVPEHLCSAIFLAGVSDVNVYCPEGQVPLCGAGINHFYRGVLGSREGVDSEYPLIRVVKKLKFKSRVHGIDTLITAEPSDTLDVIVKSAKHPDVIDLEEESLELYDLPVSFREHVSARALARLQDWKYYPFLVLAKLGYAINPETYVLATPNDTAATIRSKMAPLYRAGGNEHLAHTAVCDFPGELLLIGSSIKGKFTLENTNHLTRVNALRMFHKEEGFVSEN